MTPSPTGSARASATPRDPARAYSGVSRARANRRPAALARRDPAPHADPCRCRARWRVARGRGGGARRRARPATGVGHRAVSPSRRSHRRHRRDRHAGDRGPEHDPGSRRAARWRRRSAVDDGGTRVASVSARRTRGRDARRSVARRESALGRPGRRRRADPRPLRDPLRPGPHDRRARRHRGAGPRRAVVRWAGRSGPDEHR